MLRIFYITLFIFSPLNYLLSQESITLNKDALISQISAIESAIQHEDYLVFKKLNKEFFDKKRVNGKDRNDIIINSLFKKLIFTTKKKNTINLNRRLNLEIIEFYNNSVLIKANIFGYLNSSVERVIYYKMNTKNKIVFNFEDIVSTINNLKEKLK